MWGHHNNDYQLLFNEIQTLRRELKERDDAVLAELRKIFQDLQPKPPVGFRIQQHVVGEKTDMSTNPTSLVLVAGSVVNLTASPLDASGNPTTLPTGAILEWTSSDPTNVPVTSSGTAGDLTAVATVDAAPPAEGVTFSVDIVGDSVVTGTSSSDEVDANAPAPVASFGIVQAIVTPPAPNVKH